MDSMKTYSTVVAVVALALTLAVALTFALKGKGELAPPSNPKVETTQSAPANTSAQQKVSIPSTRANQTVTIQK